LSNQTETVEHFVDREGILSQLDEAMAQTISSGTGRAVLITGEPGIGKSALVREFLRRTQKENLTVLRTAGLPFTTGAYASMTGIFASLLETKTVVQQGKQVARVLLDLARLLPGASGYADVASDMLEGAKSLSSHDLQSISGSLYAKTLLVSLLEKLSKKKQLIVFFDDIQWFDEFSLEALGFMILNLSRINALVIMNSRTGYAMSERERSNLDAIKELAEAGYVIELPLQSLELRAAEKLVKHTLGAPRIEPRTLDTLVGRSNGNPLLLTKTVRELASQKIIAPSEDGWRLYGDASKVVPASVSSLLRRVLLRVQNENHVARTVLDYAAILGSRFNVALVAELAALDSLSAKHILEELESVYGLIRATESPSVYTFDHDLTREVILSSIGELARPYHLKAAKLLDASGATRSTPQLTAYHYEAAREFKKAFELYGIAAKSMELKLAFVEEAGYLGKCLELSTNPQVALSKKLRSALLLESSKALFSSGRFNEAFSNALESLRATAIPGARRAEAHLLAGKCCRYLGTAEAGSVGIRHLKDAVSLYSAINDQSKVGEAYSSLSTLADHFDKSALSKESFDRSRKAFNLARDTTGLAILQRKSGMIYDARQVIRFIENAIQVFKKTDSTIELARCYNNLGGEHFYIGELDQAKESLLQALELYRRFEFYEVDAPLNNLALVQMQTGELLQARESLLEAERRASEDFNRICVGSNLATLDRLTGSPDDARDRMSDLIPLVSKSGEPMIQDYFAFNMATLLSAQRRYEDALDWLEKYPPNKWKGDDGLIMAKRMLSKSKILAGLRRDREAEEAEDQARQGFRTNRPQKWFYELDYYPCDIHILD
jgi:tetratricopeptide (TPR) repeat protein